VHGKYILFNISKFGDLSERQGGMKDNKLIKIQVVCGFIWRKWSYAIGWNIVTRKKC